MDLPRLRDKPYIMDINNILDNAPDQGQDLIITGAMRESLRGYRIAWEPKLMRHFTCRFERLDS